MKKLLFLFSTGILLTGCGGEKSEYESIYDKDRKGTADTTASETQTTAPADNATAEATVEESEYAKGMKLISLSDCLSCHNENTRIVGPSYAEVAEKYEFNDKNVDYLAGKIITGGKGVWGEIPMTPHPNISKEDASEMARYVLSLKKE